MSTVSLRTAAVASTVSWDLLDAEERSRAARRTDPAPFVTAHDLLRRLVAEQVGVEPGALAFERACPTCGSTRHGKPRIVGHPEVHVSVSYGDRVAVAALSLDGAVGVDVEAIEAADFDGFDRVTLAPEEMAGLAGYAGRDLLRARCRIWARKEAILKATGHGLAIDPTQVVVSAASAAAALVAWRAEVPLTSRVAAADVSCDEDHHIAVAVLGESPLAVTPA